MNFESEVTVKGATSDNMDPIAERFYQNSELYYTLFSDNIFFWKLCQCKMIIAVSQC